MCPLNPTCVCDSGKLQRELVNVLLGGGCWKNILRVPRPSRGGGVPISWEGMIVKQWNESCLAGDVLVRDKAFRDCALGQAAWFL